MEIEPKNIKIPQSTIDWIYLIVNGGPFAVLVAVIIIISVRSDTMPKELLVVTVQNVPWLLSVLVLVWIVVHLVKTHQAERTDLVNSLSGMHDKLEDVVRDNTKVNTQLIHVVTEFRRELEMFTYHRNRKQTDFEMVEDDLQDTKTG